MIDTCVLRRIIAWIELCIAAMCLLLGGFVLVDSLRNPESYVHGWGVIGGILFLSLGTVLFLGALGLLVLKRRHWILHLPLLIWVCLLVALENAWLG